MRFNNRFNLLLRGLVSAVLMSIVFSSPSNAIELPESQKVLFILDVSGSTNSAQLWKEYLRPSLIKKLSQPFGYILNKGLKKGTPADISITTVQTNSIDSPIFEILTSEDSYSLWAAVDKSGGGNTSSARLKEITSDIFGGTGAWTVQSSFLTKQKVIIPSLSTCIDGAINGFKNSQYFNDEPISNQRDIASSVCAMAIKIGNRILQVDNYFKNPKCGINTGKSPKTCSDIIGAIYLATSAAYDLKKDSKFCLAIASDMLNESLGVGPNSPLDSRGVAMKVKSAQEARTLGAKAAELAGAKFPKNVEIKVSILGQGTGPRPLPLDKNSYLSAYWDGFWSFAGIKSSNSVRSLDRACS